jgi:methyl-accepting chemotaxis protein
MSKKKSARPAKKLRPVGQPDRRSPEPWSKLAASTLDGLQANVFIAKPQYEIIYINACAQETLGRLAGEIRRTFDIDVQEMVGLSIHRFHRDPARIEKILASPSLLPHQTLFTFGQITLEARINQIPGPRGNTLGYSVTWEDVSLRQRLELDYAGQIAAIHRSQAVVDFELDGTVTGANDNFLNMMGYRLEEVKGQHHRMFADEAERTSAGYREFWERLNRGEFVSGEFRRIAKGGREVFINGVYSPITDKGGKPFKVVKFATDVTL